MVGGRCFAFLLVGGRFLFLRMVGGRCLMVGGLWSVGGGFVLRPLKAGKSNTSFALVNRGYPSGSTRGFPLY